MKRLFIFSLFNVSALSSFAQTAEASQATSSSTLLYVVMGLLVAVLFVVIGVTVQMLRVMNVLVARGEQERAAREGIVYKPRPSFWQNLWHSSNDFVELEKEQTILLDHNYDGIHELDNHLPPWWKGLLYLSIVFAFVYLVLYHITDTLPLQTKEYEMETASLLEMAKKNAPAQGGPALDASTVEAATDAESLANGKVIFTNNCASCHLADGGGDIGPNLTDNFWKNGNGGIKDIFKIVSKGVPNTNMIAWESQFSPEKIRNVSSFVLTLHGTKPAKAKAPEGKEITAVADTTATTKPASANATL